MTGEFENDIYTVKIRLQYLIPEFLPIRGKRARIYYHGIAPYCIVSNTSGHTKPECFNNPVPWVEYIRLLKEKGIPSRLFHPVVENPNYSPNNSLIAALLTSTPRSGKDSALTEELRSMLQGVLSKAGPSQSQSQAQSPSTSGINPTLSGKKNNPNNSQGSINPTIQAQRGRGVSVDPTFVAGRGRSNSFHPPGKGRGRGRGGGPPDPNLNKGRGGYYFRRSK